MAFKSFKDFPLSASALSSTSGRFISWALMAKLGTTPPYSWCTAHYPALKALSAAVSRTTWEARASPNTWPLKSSIATPLSSQLVSMPSTEFDDVAKKCLESLKTSVFWQLTFKLCLPAERFEQKCCNVENMHLFEQCRSSLGKFILTSFR